MNNTQRYNHLFANSHPDIDLTSDLLTSGYPNNLEVVKDELPDVVELESLCSIDQDCNGDVVNSPSPVESSPLDIVCFISPLAVTGTSNMSNCFQIEDVHTSIASCYIQEAECMVELAHATRAI